MCRLTRTLWLRLIRKKWRSCARYETGEMTFEPKPRNGLIERAHDQKFERERERERERAERELRNGIERASTEGLGKDRRQIQKMHVSWLWARIGCEWTRGRVSNKELLSNDTRRGISQREKKTQTDPRALSKFVV